MADLDAQGIRYLELYPLLRKRQAAGKPTYLEYHLTPSANAAVAAEIGNWLAQEAALAVDGPR